MSRMIVITLLVILAAIFFTLGIRAIASTIVLEINSNPQDSYAEVSNLILRAMLFFAISFVLITLSH